MYIKHTSRHYYKLGSNREFYDQDNPLSPEQTQVVLDLQEKYDALILYLQEAYQALRSGGTAPEVPPWLSDEVNAKTQPTPSEVDLKSPSPEPQPVPSNTSPSKSTGNQNRGSTRQTSSSQTA